jgi:hypothetical protein
MPLTKHAVREPKQMGPVVLLYELAVVDCCVDVSFYAP